MQHDQGRSQSYCYQLQKNYKCGRKIGVDDKLPTTWLLTGSVVAIYSASCTKAIAAIPITMIKDLTSLIIKHTVTSTRHLTPELAVRVIDPTCPLWTATEDQSPFKDPFWAFYWPGGQATARYLLDNRNMVKDRQVLDLGCGCGAGSIAALKMGAKRVLANDIDLYATTAAQINAKINNVASLQTSTSNFIGQKCEEFDTILIGDMFYDEEFANYLFQWLLQLSLDGKTVLIGDPGRHGLTDKRRKQIQLLAKYVLPKQSCIENHGFTETSLWMMNKTK